MTIAADSSMADIYAAHYQDAVTAGMTDITLVNTSIIKVGLALYDLTTFKADCTTADACTEANYSTFDGYALYGAVSDAKAQTDKFGACFADKSCFVVNPSGDNYSYDTIVLAAAASASNPPNLDSGDSVTCQSNLGGFNEICFGFKVTEVTAGDARVWRFVEKTDTTYVVGAVTQVVGVDAGSAAASTNVVQSVTLELAAALVSAATVAGSVAFSLLI